MFTKNYLKELIRKQTISEWIMVGVFLFGILFFSVFDIDGGIVLSAQWTSGAIGVISQMFIVIGAFMAALTVMNRMHRFKQELPFLLSGALLTGSALIMQGYELWSDTNGMVGASTMGPGFVQMFIFGMSALAGLAKFAKHESNVVPAVKKVFSKELLIATITFLIVIGPYYMIFDKFSANNSQTNGQSIDYVEWIGIIGFAFSTSAIVMMVVFRWTWTFILWTISNIFFITYYALEKTEHNLPLLSLVVISSLFAVVDSYILIKWIKDHRIETH